MTSKEMSHEEWINKVFPNKEREPREDPFLTRRPLNKDMSHEDWHEDWVNKVFSNKEMSRKDWEDLASKAFPRKEQDLYETLTVEIEGLKKEIVMLKDLLHQVVIVIGGATVDLQDAVKALRENR